MLRNLNIILQLPESNDLMRYPAVHRRPRLGKTYQIPNGKDKRFIVMPDPGPQEVASNRRLSPAQHLPQVKGFEYQ